MKEKRKIECVRKHVAEDLNGRIKQQNGENCTLKTFKICTRRTECSNQGG
jgi:hypothetical protein